MKIMIAGGGTGGHLYPGVALAEEITTRHPDNEVMFVGTQRGLEARVIPELGFPLELIQVSGLKGTGLGKRMQGFMQLPGALWQSMQLVRRFRPDVAVGVGGYASGPAILAARLCGVPTAVLEQNTVPGVTNRILGKMVDAVYVMFDGSAAYFPRGKVQRLGNPIRRQLLENFLRPPEAVEEGAPFRVLVLGGSQGAHTLNLRMVEAATTLSQTQPKLHVVHQTGRKDRELVEKGYAEAGISADVHEFIDDVSAAYREADLVVCRAGATTLAEVMVAKKPAILVPYPFAADNHQELNGQHMVDAKAAVMLVERELDGERLAQEILTIAQDPERLDAMAAASGRAGRPEASREIVDAFDDLIRRTKA